MNIGPIHYHDTESVQSAALGTRYSQESTGRVWRYAECGGTGIDRGKLAVQADVVANHVDLTPTAASAGASQITVTLGATLATKDQYANGFAVVQDADGEGIAYLIEGHPAADSAGSLTIDLSEQLVAALTTSTDVDLVQNLYKDVVISATDQADNPVGVFNVSVPADNFGMIQTWGPCAVWQDEANAVGDMLTTGTGVAGQVEAHDAVGEPFIGHQGPTAGGVADYQLVYLRLER